MTKFSYFRGLVGAEIKLATDVCRHLGMCWHNIGDMLHNNQICENWHIIILLLVTFQALDRIFPREG